MLLARSQLPFEEDDLYMCELLAPQLAAAIEHAFDNEALQDKVQQLKGVAGLAHAAPDEAEQICQAGRQLFHCDEFSLLLQEGQGKVEKGKGAPTVVPWRNPKLKGLDQQSRLPKEALVGMAPLCAQEEVLGISHRERFGPFGYDAVLTSLRRPARSAHKSMLCLPTRVHRTVLGLSTSGEPYDEADCVPALLQWTNRHGSTFSKRDYDTATLLKQACDDNVKRAQQKLSINVLEERFKTGDARRVALMESAKMLSRRQARQTKRARPFAPARLLLRARARRCRHAARPRPTAGWRWRSSSRR